MSKKNDSEIIQTGLRPSKSHKGLPTNRREALARGFIAGGGFFVVPSVLSLATSTALGQTTLADCVDNAGGGNKLPPAVLVIEARGGTSCFVNNLVNAGAGDPLNFLTAAAYRGQGIVIPPNANNINTNFGIPIYTDSALFQELSSCFPNPDETLGNKLKIVTFTNNNDDDTTNIPWGGLIYQLAKDCNANLAKIIGQTRYRVAPEHLTGDAAVALVNTTQAQALVSPGAALQIIGGPQAANNLKLFAGSRDADVARILSKFVGEGKFNTAMEKIINCGYLQSSKNLAEGVNVDWRLDPEISAALNALPAPLSAPNAAEVEACRTVATNLALGNACVGVLNCNGYDDHQDGPVDQRAKHLELSRIIMESLTIFRAKKRACAIVVVSDGAQSSNGSGQVTVGGRPMFNMTADAAQYGVYPIIYYSEGGCELVQGKQPRLGWFGENGIDNAAWAGATNQVVCVDAVIEQIRFFGGVDSPNGLIRQITP